jgi:hypothetical protein
MAEYSDPTISAFDVPEDTLVAPKRSTMAGKRPDLQPDQEFNPYSLDPTISSFDPMETIGSLMGGTEAKPVVSQQGNPYFGELLKNMFAARQRMQALGLSAADVPAGLPSMIGGEATYGLTRAFGVPEERAQQFSQMLSTPLSYLQPGKVNELFSPKENVIGQGSAAYEASPISMVMKLVSEYGAQPAVEYLMKSRGMSQLDAEHLVNSAPLLLGGGIKLGQIGVKSIPKMRAWGEELRPTEAPKERIEPMMDVGQTPQSVGAAGTSHQSAVKAQLDAMPDTSPAKQNILQEMQPTTDPHGRLVAGKSAADINLDALQTQAKFEKFGMNATKGEALNDPQLISDEYNTRAKPENKPLLDRFNERNIKLGNAFDDLREKYAENAPGGTPVALANDVLETLKNKAQAYEQNINNLYKRANTAAGESNIPIDIHALNENINNALDFEHRTEYVPKELADQLQKKLAKGYLTPQEYENFRTDTGTIARTNADPLVRRAAGIIREQFENVPLKDDFAYLKPLYDEARNAVSEWKTKQEQMPFYDAAMADTRTPEDLAKGLPHPGSTAFFDKYVNNKNIPDLDLSRLVSEVGENTPAHEALKAGSLLKLKENAVNSQGVVSQSKIYDGINKIFAGDKSRILHGPELAQDLKDLAFVATRSEHVKGGATYSNASQTQVANAREQALQAAQSAAGKLAEGAVNLKTGGLGGTAIRGALNYMNKAQIEQAAKEAHLKQLNEALKPHAGVFKE